MQQIKRKRWMSLLLSIMMIVSMINVPSFAAGNEVTLQDNITPESNRVTVNLTQAPSSGVLFILQMDANDTYSFDEINSYTKLYFSVLSTGSLNVGENILTLTQVPTAGKKVIAVVRDTGSGGGIEEYVSNAVTVKNSSSTQTKTPEEILANTTVQLMKDGGVRTDNFREDDCVLWM